ncbi:hypothetical protein NP493_879g01036 [Ridgeia piscesae]|uniref:Uncharacterized protein n=1 Tax=Ridgeia piscesae TaxID=27915 RepID=A0AAD9KKT3_RIDPI|nr:hypothetical protein NP493_879g01036 [Ridgeia piscesae]
MHTENNDIFIALSTLTLQPVTEVAVAWGDRNLWSECKCDQKKTRSRVCETPPCSGPEVESRACTCAPIDCSLCRSSGFVGDTCFYHCVKVGDLWTATQQCCNPCEVWDDYRKTCVSNASDPDCTFVLPANPSAAALPLKDMITCITFNQPDPYGIKRGQWVKVFKVLIETDHNIWNVSGNCGYFDSTNKAHLEIPYFTGNQFSQFSFRDDRRKTMKTFVLLTLLAQVLFVAANYGEWQDWSECECGETQYRLRSCTSPPCTGPSQESRPCLPRGALPNLCNGVCYGAGCSMGYVHDPCLDSCFYHCVKINGLWTATRQCCNPCERWDRQLLTCVRNSSDPECTYNPSTSAPASSLRRRGTNLRRCVWRRDRDQYYLLNVRGNCGYFNSSKKAHLEIPYFAGNQFSQFAFSFWYRRTPDVQGYMGLVGNGNSESGSTIKLLSVKNSNCGGFATEDMPDKGKYRMDAPDGEWHMYTMSYDGTHVFYYLDNVFAYNVSMTGSTIMKQCPMTTGSFLNDDFFDGYMDSSVQQRGRVLPAVETATTPTYDMPIFRAASHPIRKAS